MYQASLMAQLVKNPPAMWGDLGSIPGLGRYSGEGNGNPLQYFCLENSMDRGAWRATIMGSQRVGRDSVTEHSCIGAIRRAVPQFLSHGLNPLAGPTWHGPHWQRP